MPSCVMRFCTNYSRKTTKSDGITYHSFPLNEMRRLEWLNIVRKQRREDDWQSNNSSRICSLHFKDDDKYKSKEGRILLKKTALPYFESTDSSAPVTTGTKLSEERFFDVEIVDVYEVSLSSQSAPACSNSFSDVESLNLKCSSPVTEVANFSKPFSESPNSLVEEEDSETESILESEQIAALKKYIRKILILKQKLVNQNRNLNKRNKRLKTKVASLSAIIKHLKEKHTPPINGLRN